MKYNYIERAIASDLRFEQRLMLFAALRRRQTHIFPRRLLTSLLWVLGVR